MSDPLPIIFAIDLGTQSLRVSAFYPDGNKVWSWAGPVHSHVDGAVYTQDTAEWEEQLRSAFEEAKRAGIKPSVIAASGPLAGWTPLDHEGNALGPAVMYLDGRSARDTQTVDDAVAAAYKQAPSFRVNVADPLPQRLRLQREEAATYERMAVMLDATGWLNFFLTGAYTLNDYTALRLYSEAVCERAGVARSMFGHVVKTGAEIGMLKRELAEEYGFDAAAVIAAPFDSKCAYVAAGLCEQGRGLDISGTVTSVGVYQKKEVRDAQRRIYSIPFGDGWLVRGSTACSGSTIAWAEKHLLKMDVAAWTAKAATVKPGAQGVTFLSYLAGERTPLWNPQARGALLGIGLDTTDAVMGRAVLEGIAFSFRHVVDCMRESGAVVSTLSLSGGLAQNDLLSQMKADASGVVLYRLKSHELTSLGLVAICSVAIGAAKNLEEAAQGLMKVEKSFVPQRGVSAAYEAAYERYRKYVAALLPTFEGNGVL